jgi:hypothetical protein
MRDTIELAREAGNDDLFDAMQVAFLERLVALVRADQDEKYKWDVHSCGPTCKRYACVAMREAVEAEREACAKVCDELAGVLASHRDRDGSDICVSLRDTIRARGNT